ncbi:GlxA family transcriptional regulator [Chitinibacteraceae bacterium HSL-7]
MKTVDVAVLAFDGISLFRMSVPGMVFGADGAVDGLPPYRVRYCAQQPGRLKSDQGVVFEVEHGLELMQHADVVVVPAWHDPGLAAPAALTRALQAAHARGAQVVGLCLGAFVLGDAGLLDGREATTHWGFRSLFARRFPAATYLPDVLYAGSDGVVTSAGTVSAIDCCLNLVRQRHGAELANRVARILVTPPHRQGGQAQFIEQPVADRASEQRLAGVLEWARAHLDEPLSVERLADVACMSRRTFTRRFKEATGATVLTWLTAERVACAQRLLETGDWPIERVASAAGFGNAQALRQHFARQLGTSPAAYRSVFRREAPQGHVTRQAAAQDA